MFPVRHSITSQFNGILLFCSYPLGKSFEDEALDGRFCTVVMNIENSGDKLVTHQTSLDLQPPVNTVVSRVFSADKMIMTLQCQDVLAKAEFKRVKNTEKL